YVATESHSVSFHQLCPEHHARIKYRRWCPVGEHEVNYGEVERGYEVGDDRYVIIEEKDLENLPLPTSRAIEINEFVPKGESLADDFDPERYHDGYHEALMKVVEAKLEGKVVEAPEEPAETRVMDLMEALRASVEAAKSKKEAPAAEAKEKPKRARKAS